MFLYQVQHARQYSSTLVENMRQLQEAARITAAQDAAIAHETQKHEVLLAFHTRPDDVERVTLYTADQMFRTGRTYAYVVPPATADDTADYYIDCGLELY